MVAKKTKIMAGKQHKKAEAMKNKKIIFFLNSKSGEKNTRNTHHRNKILFIIG